MDKIDFIPLIELPTIKGAKGDIVLMGTSFINTKEWDLYQENELKNYIDIPVQSQREFIRIDFLTLKFSIRISPEKFKISKRRLKFLKLHSHFDRICFDRFNIHLSLRQIWT